MTTTPRVLPYNPPASAPEGVRRRPRAVRLSPDRTRARFRLERLEDRRVPATITSIGEFAIPSGDAPNPNGAITTGPDGNVWFTAGPRIGVINPTTHAVSEYTVPGTSVLMLGITAGPDGNLWFTDYNNSKVGFINPITHAISEFTSKGYRLPRGIVAGPDGNLWFCEWSTTPGAPGALGRINPTTHAITNFPVPSTFNPIPEYITNGPDGNLWFTETMGGQIGTINLTTYAISMIALPGAGTWGTRPYAITSGPGGNLWFTQYSTGNSGPYIGAINPTTHALTTYAIPPTVAGDWSIASGPDGNLWFTNTGGGQITSLNPSTGAMTPTSVPYTGATTGWIAIGPDHNLWYSDPGTKSIGVATLSSNQAMSALPAGAIGTNGVTGVAGPTFLAPDPALVPLVLGDAAFLDAIAARKRHLIS